MRAEKPTDPGAKVTDETVTWGYRIALGREPENDAVVSAHSKRAQSLHDLRSGLFSSDEFRGQMPSLHAMAPVATADRLDINHPNDPLLRERLFQHIARSWSRYGETEPHWSVLTEDRYLSQTLPGQLDEFNESGRNQVNYFLRSLARNGLALPKDATCIELGCGVGRITRWLAPHVAKVIGLDVSPGHLALAREHVGRHAQNAEFRQLRALEDLAELPPAQLFYTFLVLQHNPPPVIEALLDGLFARLTPGGIAFVHVPVHIPDYRFDTEGYLAEREDQIDMEMHALPQKDVFKVAARNGMQVLEVINQTSPQMIVADCLLLQKT